MNHTPIPHSKFVTRSSSLGTRVTPSKTQMNARLMQTPVSTTDFGVSKSKFWVARSKNFFPKSKKNFAVSKKIFHTVKITTLCQ
jgi:hypothetical protein